MIKIDAGQAMRVFHEYSHLGSAEILHARYPQVQADIQEIISLVTADKDDLEGQLRLKGYQAVDNPFQFAAPVKGEGILSSEQVISFAKDRVFVSIRYNDYPLMFYDMAKFQYFFNENKADVGVEIVPCHALHKQMSSGISCGEQLIHDIEGLRRHFPAVPVKVILIDVQDED
jgi:hypothetical protein